MNEMAVVSGVKSLSDEDRAKHLKAINEGRKAIDRHQRDIREHLKAMMDDLGDEDAESDTNLVDDSSIEDEEMNKAFLAQIQELAIRAKALAN
jgi:uncharacterized protein